MDTGDHVIIVNADKVVLTGGKEKKKFAYRHSGYPGGITATRYDELMSTRPVFAVEKAIRGMLPKNRLGRSMIRKLHVVGGAEHPHAAQQPVDYTLGRPPVWEGLPIPKPVTELKTRHLTSDDEAEAAEEATVEPADEKPASTKPAAKKTTAKKPAAKPATAKKATAKKATAKKATAKKTAAKKTTDTTEE
jgi:hypothetical protein